MPGLVVYLKEWKTCKYICLPQKFDLFEHAQFHKQSYPFANSSFILITIQASECIFTKYLTFPVIFF